MKDIKWKEVTQRLVADFVIIHASMMGALLISVAYRTALGHGPEARSLIEVFTRHYLAFFWLLSPIFPIVFFLNGFYTHKRAYTGGRKAWVVLRGVITAIVLFFGANVLLFGYTDIGRSVILPFMALAGVGLTLARLIKAYFELHFVVKRRDVLLMRESKGRVLVVGGAGYIGSLLVERLLEDGYSVRVLDCLLYGDEALRSVQNHPGFELIVGDCRKIQDVVRAMRGVDSVIHLAAIVGDQACDEDHETALEINYAATRMLVEIAKGHGVSRFLFASSCSVYGATDLELDEKAAVQPLSLYARTKVDSERALLEAGSDAFHPTVLRFATVFGLSYRPRFDLAVNVLTAKAWREGVVTINNKEQWRPFIHVRDLVEAIVQVLQAPVRLVSGEVINVGDQRLNHTLADVVDIIRGVFPAVQVEYIESPDRRNYRVRFDKLLRKTGFRARYTVLDGVEEMKKALDESVIADYTDVRYHNQRYLKTVGSPSRTDELDTTVMVALAGSAR